MFIKLVPLFIFVVSCLSMAGPVAYGQETITVALTSKAFQYTILPVAQERGYMKKEGIDLKIV